MIKRIGTYVGTIMGVIGLTTLVFTQGIKHEQKRVTDSSVEIKVDKLITADSLQNIKWDTFQGAVLDSIANISGQLRDQNKKIHSLATSQDNLRMYMIQNAPTKEDMVEILNIWDVKKNINFNGMAFR